MCSPIRNYSIEPLSEYFSSKVFDEQLPKSGSPKVVCFGKAIPSRAAEKADTESQSQVAANRGFHGDKPRGEPSLKRPMQQAHSKLHIHLARSALA